MQNFLDEAKSIASKEKREILMITTRASVNGAITGLVLGLMLGYWKNKNVYVTGLVGAIIGGVATSIIINKK